MKHFYRGLLIFISLIACFAIGFSWTDIKGGKAPNKEAFLNALIPNIQSSRLTPTQLFKRAYDTILDQYYKKLEPQKLTYAGMSGLLSTPGDQNTVFMDPQSAESFNREARANLVGIGALLSSDPLGVKIGKVFPGTPAKRAGLKSGDIITAVDGKSISGETIDRIVRKIRGEKNTLVTLKVLRGKKKKSIIFKIRRQLVSIPTVDSKFFEKEKIGYISISQFADATAKDFDKHYKDLLKKEDMRGLILDLRWNLGGLYDSAKEILSKFVSNKAVVIMKFRGNKRTTEFTSTSQVYKRNFPIVLVVNQSSASASEIVAGALRDHGLAKIVGTRTHGKGSIQIPFPLRDKSVAKITIAKYLTPSGKDIDRKVNEDKEYISGGLDPDYKVSLEDAKNFELSHPVKDPQIKKAISVLEVEFASKFKKKS